MPIRPPKACSTCGKGGCEEHKKQRAKKLYAGTNEPLYRLARWLRFRVTLLSCNPTCQRIINGVQCSAKATIGHHLVDPKHGGGLCDPSNVVGCCAAHHPGGQPGETTAHNWVETKWIFGARYPHPQVIDSKEIDRMLANIGN